MVKNKTNDELNAAAAKLVELLPSEAQTLIEIIQSDRHVELWQICAGVLLEAYQNYNLTAFQFDPDWSDAVLTKTFSKCMLKSCGKRFKPTHLGQRFCSNKCGDIANGVYHEPEPPPPTYDSRNVAPNKYASRNTSSGWGSGSMDETKASQAAEG